jgi:hypothetical protein
MCAYELVLLLTRGVFTDEMLPGPQTMDTIANYGQSVGRLFSPGASRNKEPIRDRLKDLLGNIFGSSGGTIKLIEVASGTGEHAAYLASGISNLHVLPTEPDAQMHTSIVDWSHDVLAPGSRIFAPLCLDVQSLSPEALASSKDASSIDFIPADVLLCINMIHISPWSSTPALFLAASALLRPGGVVFTYGPYRENGQMVPSNEAFDASLKSRDPSWGVRDLEEVAATAVAHGFHLLEDGGKTYMPANNMLLAFIKR